MFLTLVRSAGNVVALGVVLGWLGSTETVHGQDQPDGVAASKADVLALTSAWEGERTDDGRPKVPDALLERLKAVSIEEAWDVLRQRGYEHQYEGDWQVIHPDRPIVGRALTAGYLPGRPDLVEHVIRTGAEEERIGPPNSWPIDMLQPGDVYIADGCGKIADGTLIGDNLGNAIYTKSGNGVVFNASARDLAGLSEIEGFNAFVRGWHPSFLKDMVLTTINQPIRIGSVTVLPGDVILAKRTGVIAIPPHLVEEVVVTAEVVALKDTFGHIRLRAGVYNPGQIDIRWTDEIKADFFEWLKTHPNPPPIPREVIEPLL